MNKTDLERFGFRDIYLAEAALYPGYFAGRIISQHKDLYKVVCENGEMLAEVSGKFRFGVKALSDFPAVGDFVMLDRDIGAKGNAIIHHLLSRKSAFIRRAAGTSNDEQVVASNIDTIFICMSVNNDFNLRRLERYLSVSWDSGAAPIIVLTKSDLCANIEQKLYEVDSIALGTLVLATSSIYEDGHSGIASHIKKGETIAFIGSSGVGKSTLINRLLGENRLDTKEIKKDDKGKHTTTRRELILLPNGGMVIDTPGMRELGIESADFSKSFGEIEELSGMCKFQDCSHTSEPGCAVQKAIHEGTLSADRLLSYQKLKKEAKYEGLNSRQIENVKINEMFKGMGGMKNARKFIKEKNRKRR